MKLVRQHILLFTILCMGFVLVVRGILWGRVQEWNPDQMALYRSFFPNRFPYIPAPGDLLKPPLLTYLHYYLSIFPLEQIGKLFLIHPLIINQVIFTWSRFLTLVQFLVSIGFVYLIFHKVFSQKSALITAFIYATSAGVIAYAHFLTTDLPLFLWLAISIYYIYQAAQYKHTKDYVVAGFIIGLTTAMKYNGVVAFLGLIAVYIFSNDLSLVKCMKEKRKLLYAIFSLTGGFLLANPYAFFDYERFISDFYFNLVTTPVFNIEKGTSYIRFFSSITELIGLPVFIISTVGLALYIWVFVRSKAPHKTILLAVIISAITIPYFLFFGSYPTLPTRYVMPALFFFLFGVAYLFEHLNNKWVFCVILVFIATYNISSSIYVGNRFLVDPRGKAQEWLVQNVKAGEVIENYAYAPTWNYLPEFQGTVAWAPEVAGRKKKFEKLFKTDKTIQEQIEYSENWYEMQAGWHTEEALLRRKPQYVAINSLHYNRFLKEPLLSEYKDVSRFYISLLNEDYNGYQIVFDQKTKKTRGLYTFLYPKDIDFLENRMIILKYTKD